MSLNPPTSLTASKAHEILQQFNCLQPGDAQPTSNLRVIQEALLTVAQHSDYQILGICADSLEQGLATLKAYAKALGYEIGAAELPQTLGAVYIKFNPKSGLLYTDGYTGEHRGVLVSCQSAEETDINEMYGHLPLSLFT